MMIFYHSTSILNWDKIQSEGVLWGVRDAPTRCTYLALEAKDCPDDDVLLEVEYDPQVNPEKNNYNEKSWQCRVYEPMCRFKRIIS